MYSNVLYFKAPLVFKSDKRCPLKVTAGPLKVTAGPLNMTTGWGHLSSHLKDQGALKYSTFWKILLIFFKSVQKML